MFLLCLHSTVKISWQWDLSDFMVLQRALSYFWQSFNMTKSEVTQLETFRKLCMKVLWYFQKKCYTLHSWDRIKLQSWDKFCICTPGYWNFKMFSWIWLRDEMLQCRKQPGLFQRVVTTIALKRLLQLMCYDAFSLMSHTKCR